jgi:hypothetical protein
MLFCKDEHYIIKTDIGKEILNNSNLFLTQKASRSFSGYAISQLRRLENNIARNTTQSKKEEHILGSIKSQMRTFEDRYKEQHGISLHIDNSDKEEFDTEIFIDINLNHYPLRDLKAMYSEMNNVVRDYNKLNHRNKKKTDKALSKHFMHLVRLYLMGTEILKGEKPNTYRYNDRNLLLDIRNGKYQNKDGTYRQEAFDFINILQKDFEHAEKHTEIPSKPNMKKIEEFVMDINKRCL